MTNYVNGVKKSIVELMKSAGIIEFFGRVYIGNVIFEFLWGIFRRNRIQKVNFFKIL